MIRGGGASSSDRTPVRDHSPNDTCRTSFQMTGDSKNVQGVSQHSNRRVGERRRQLSGKPWFARSNSSRKSTYLADAQVTAPLRGRERRQRQQTTIESKARREGPSQNILSKTPLQKKCRRFCTNAPPTSFICLARSLRACSPSRLPGSPPPPCPRTGSPSSPCSVP